MSSHSVISASVSAALAIRGISKADLARRLGHYPSWVTMRLEGDRPWRIDDLDKLGAVFGMAPASFLIPPTNSSAADNLHYLPRQKLSSVAFRLAA